MRLQKRTLRSEEGFTLLEMVVAIIVLSLLALIAMSTFLNRTQTAQVAVAQTDLDTAYRATAALWEGNGGSLAPTLVTDLQNSEKELSIQDSTSYTQGKVSVHRIDNNTAVFKNVASDGTDVAMKAVFGSGYAVYRVQGTNPAVTTTNLMPNPSFESDLNNYTNYADLNIAQASDWSEAGRYSASISGTFPKSGFAEDSLTSAPVPVTANQAYTASAYVNIKSCSNLNILAPRIYITWLDGGKNQLSQSNTAGTWFQLGVQRLVNTDTAPPAAQYAVVEVVFANGSSVDIWNQTISTAVDAIQLQTGSAVSPYFDGNFPDGIWTGVANNSSSTAPAWKTWADSGSGTGA